MQSELVYLPVKQATQNRFELPKGIASLRTLNGERLTKLISSSSFEFRELKNYTEGDSLKNIHWKTGARVGNLMVKTFFEEQKQDYCFALDCSTSMMSGIQQPILQNAIDICYSFINDCKKNKFKISLAWNNNELKITKPSILSSTNYKTATQNLYSPKTLEHVFDVSNLLSKIINNKITYTNIVLISSGAWTYNVHTETIRQINLAQNKNRLFVLGLFPLNYIPTSGIYVFEDPSSGQVCEIDFSYKPAVEYILKQKSTWQKNLQRFCSSHKINFLTLAK